jgi:hypothetical protein
MKNVSLILLAMLSLTFFVGITSPTYAAELDLKTDTHDLNTQNSWFQPAVIRNSVNGRSYAWTVQGQVIFTKESGKWNGWYSDAGGLLWYMPSTVCHSYGSPYIKGARLNLVWAYIDPRLSSINYLAGVDKSEIHNQTYEIGNTTEN